MCNDEALNVVISTINANIHVVFVHVDLHEKYLLNVKKNELITIDEIFKISTSHQYNGFTAGTIWIPKSSFFRSLTA
jgi:hypothetical protein